MDMADHKVESSQLGRKAQCVTVVGHDVAKGRERCDSAVVEDVIVKQDRTNVKVTSL